MYRGYCNGEQVCTLVKENLNDTIYKDIFIQLSIYNLWKQFGENPNGYDGQGSMYIILAI